MIPNLFLVLVLVLGACAPTTAPAAPACVDVNAAPREALYDVIHIDEARSLALIALRPFVSLEDLARIPGIASARIADIREQGLVCPLTQED